MITSRFPFGPSVHMHSLMLFAHCLHISNPRNIDFGFFSSFATIVDALYSRCNAGTVRSLTRRI